MPLGSASAAKLRAKIDINMEQIDALINGEEDLLSLLRKHNYLDCLVTFLYNDFHEKETLHTDFFSQIINETQKINMQNKKYQENFYTSVNTNFIQMLEKYITEIDDEDVKSYLRYVKYIIICTTPKYEENYWLFGHIALPTIDMSSSFPVTEGYSESEINALVKHSLKSGLEDDIRTLGDMNNLIFPYYAKKIYRMLALNKARLISLKDLSFIEEIERSTNEYIHEGDSFYSLVNDCQQYV